MNGTFAKKAAWSVFSTEQTGLSPVLSGRHGRVEEAAVPWAERYQRVTGFMAQAVVVWLQARGRVSQVAKVMRLNWHMINAIMKAAVGRVLERRERERIEYLGLDEKSFRRGHVYATMLNDLDGGRVWDLVEGRKEEEARELLQGLDTTQRVGVKAVAMDIWSA